MAVAVAQQKQSEAKPKPASTQQQASSELLQEQLPIMPSAVAIQTQLILGHPDDKYEREADAVAHRIMRMPNRNGPVQRFSAIQLVQPKCKACEEERIQRLAFSEDEEFRSTNQLSIQRKTNEQEQAAAPSATTGFTTAPQLKSGGSPLPGTTRRFFESRFNRDLSQVRIHRGNQSATLNQQIHSYAFTYANHIWLGAGQGASPSHLMAHELTHVIQQTQPSGLTDQDQFPLSTAEDSIQRFAPYWEPYDFNGTRNHNLILPSIGAANNIFTEAPVPNASKHTAQYGNRGIADMYIADRTVGVFFEGSQNPAYLRSPRHLKYAGQRYRHSQESAPRSSRNGRVTRVDQAPSDIKVGDLKPSHGTLEAAEGPTQLRNYRDGFGIAQREINDMATSGSPYIHPSGSAWNLSTGIIGRNQITIPAEFAYPAASGQSSRRLVIKHNGRRIIPRDRVMGKVFVQADPTNSGIWNYTWVPDQRVTLTSLPPRIRNLGAEVNRGLIAPIMESPVRRAAKARPGSPPTAAPPIRPDRSAKVRRVVRDSFDQARLRQWNQRHSALTRDYRSVSRTNDFERTEEAMLAVKAQDAIQANTGINVPQASQVERQNVRTVKKIQFWTGLNARPFGLFRRVFGRTFVKVANAYQRIRQRFRERLRNRRKRFSSNLTGAAMKAAFTVIKLAGSFVVQQTMARLIESLKTGVSEKLRELIEPERIEDIQTKLQEIQQMREEMEAQASATAESIMESVLGPYVQHLETLENLQRIVGNIANLINLVRWGARVVACLSPPAVGCLWILGQAALEFAAAQVVDTCWFKKKITPLIAGIDFIRGLPAELARIIVGQVRRVLPESLHGIFADIDTSSIQVRPEDIECEEGSGGQPLTAEQQAWLDLQERLGEEQFMAYLELLRRAGTSPERELSVEEIRNIGEVIEQSGVSAEEMRAYANNYTESENTIPISLREMLRRMSNESEGTRGEGSGEATADTESRGGVPVLDGQTAQTNATSHGRIENARVRVAGVASGHTVNTRPTIALNGFMNGEHVVQVQNVRVRVVRRTWWPNSSDRRGLVIHYELLHGVSFSPYIRNGMLEQGKIVRGLLRFGGSDSS
ncbi:MAG: DUF4157 domain-containing protein [Bacteroidota bacterium]